MQPLAALHLALPAAVVICWGCDGGSRDPGPAGAASAPWFADASDEVGLSFTHDPGQPGNYFMPEVIGSGAALLDADGDRRLDIYLLQNAGAESSSRNVLFRQGADGRFTASAGSGLEAAGRGMGVAVGDADNDGQVEVLVTEYGRARLFHNEGGGKLADVTAAAGIDNPFWGASASFLDYNRDGWLDLAIVNYVLYSATRPCSDQAGRRDYCGPQPFPGTAAKLFLNGSGEAGAPRGLRFQDVTIRSGLARATGPGLGILCADFTGDGWVDIFVANDGKPNFLWVNQKDGTFVEEAVLRGLAINGMGQPQADMGIAVGDIDGDLLFDLFVTHLTDEQHILLRQGPRGQFLDGTAAAGLTGPAWRSTGFGTVFGDFDLDGDLDLALANGRVKFTTGPSPPGTPYWDAYRERNQLFAGDGQGSFRDVSAANPAFCGTPAIARALASGDIDDDGDIDLLVTNVAERARLLRNVAAPRGAWLRVRAIEPAHGGRDAYGAEVTLSAGGKRWWALIEPAQSYFSSCDPRACFGLGGAASVERIDVLWPDGALETFPGGAANREVTLERGRGTPGTPAAAAGGAR